MDLLYVLFVLSLVSMWSACMLASATRRRSAINAIVDEAKLELEEGIRHIRGEIATVPSSTPRRFEAFCACPKCGRLDHHWLQSPKPAPTDAEMEEWRRNSTTYTIEQWGGGVTRTDVFPPVPVDESQFEVIRICTGCGHEFGQI